MYVICILNRVPPQNSYVPETVEGLQQVADAGDWRSVVDISGKLISNEDFVVAANETLSLSLQLRFEGLFRMKLFDDLSLEISKVLGSQSGLDENRRGPTVYVIVSLTVLLAEIKSLTGRGSEALEQLYRLRANLRIMSSAVTGGNDNLIIQWWQMKVWNQIINILLRQRQWHLALHELSELLFEIRSLRDLSQDGAFSEIEGTVLLIPNHFVYLFCFI